MSVKEKTYLFLQKQPRLHQEVGTPFMFPSWERLLLSYAHSPALWHLQDVLWSCWAQASSLGDSSKALEEDGGHSGGNSTDNTRQYFSEGFGANRVFEGVLTWGHNAAHHLWWPGKKFTVSLMPVRLILTLHILQSLALTDNAAFWNCLVAMHSKTSSCELPSAYDISTHLHNQTQQWLASSTPAYFWLQLVLSFVYLHLWWSHLFPSATTMTLTTSSHRFM